MQTQALPLDYIADIKFVEFNFDGGIGIGVYELQILEKEIFRIYKGYKEPQTGNLILRI